MYALAGLEIKSEARHGRGGSIVKAWPRSGLDRFDAAATHQGTIAREAEAVLLEVLLHFLLPGVDDPHSFHLVEARVVQPRPHVVQGGVVLAQEMEYGLRAHQLMIRRHPRNVTRGQGIRAADFQHGPEKGPAARRETSRGRAETRSCPLQTSSGLAGRPPWRYNEHVREVPMMIPGKPRREGLSGLLMLPALLVVCLASVPARAADPASGPAAAPTPSASTQRAEAAHVYTNADLEA